MVGNLYGGILIAEVPNVCAYYVAIVGPFTWNLRLLLLADKVGGEPWR